MLRSVVIPAAAAVALVTLFFTLLLTGPRSPGDETIAPAAGPAAAPAPVKPVPAREPAACPVPELTGEAGVVGERFAGKRTSSGQPYDPNEPGCIVNSAAALGELAYGTEVRLTRIGAPEQSAVCRIVGRWNGERQPERIVLVSSLLAHKLAIAERGLAEVACGCPRQPAAQPEVQARLAAAE